MDRDRLQFVVGIAMIALGALLAVLAAMDGEALLTGIWVVYAVVGGVYLWREWFVEPGA